MGRISIEYIKEQRRINFSIRQHGMRETIRRIMEEKEIDCPTAKLYVHRYI